MSKKNLKKLIPAIGSVLALSVGAFLGLSDSATNELEGAFATLGTILLTIAGILGVWTNNDK